MNVRWAFLIIGLFGGCAQSSAQEFDASVHAVDDLNAPDAARSVDGGVGPDGLDPLSDAGCELGAPGCPGMARDDAAVSAHDGGASLPDAAPSANDAGAHDDAGLDDDAGSDLQVIRAKFKVKQANAALQLPLATNIRLELGDELRLIASGRIWPGLIGQDCNGPNGTSGGHDEPSWPLRGGPDFALIAYVNDAWSFVGSDRTFTVTEPGLLHLGTNDDDGQSGDDCTSVPVDQQGFTVSIEVTRALEI